MITKREHLIDYLISMGFHSCPIEMTIRPFIDMASYRHGLSFTIPKDYDKHVFKEDNGGPVILIDSSDGWRIFHLHTFFKNVWAYDKDKNPLGYHKHASGSAVDHISRFTDLKAALDSLVGKKLIVSKVEECYRLTSHGCERCTIPTIDIVDNNC